MNQDKEVKPLYKVLDEQRSKGEWVIKDDGYDIMSKESGDWIFESVATGDGTMTPNAQYTALAVNNLAGIAEALEEMINSTNELVEADKQGFNLFDYLLVLKTKSLKAKEALSKIS